MATTTRLVLPPELEDRVIDHLYDDYLALSVCATVCSSWLPSARLHLFHHLTLSCSTIPGFLDVLNKTSAIGAYVKCLDVDCVVPIWVVRSCDCSGGDRAGPALVDILQRMENLRQLNIHRIQLAPTALPTLRSLEELRLARIRGDSVVDCIFSLPRLRSLFVTQVYSDYLHPDLRAFSPTIALLSDVRLWCLPENHDFCTALARRLVAYDVGSRLRFLSLVVSDGHHPLALLESILAFLRSLGPSLDRLELALLPLLSDRDDANTPYASIKRQLRDSFTLSQCRNIRHLRLLGCHGDEVDFLPDTNNLDWAIDFLSNLACSGVTDITFVLDTTAAVHVRDPWLDQMLPALAARTSFFANLERIIFELSTAYMYNPPTADGRRTRVLRAAKCIAKRWGNWRRQGLAFEVAENEKAPIAWGARDEDGALVISARTILVSADGKKPFRLCDQ